MLEAVFLFVSLFVLAFWLFATDTLADWRRLHRARRVRELLRALKGKELARAEALFGPATEIVAGSTGRRLYVWKDPATPAVPHAASLLIITVTVDATGIITNAAWEER